MIPEALTPLIGRGEELRELTQLVADGRFVSLIGPGGVGKTRLAVEVARVPSRARWPTVATSSSSHRSAIRRRSAPRSRRRSMSPMPRRLAELIGDRELVIVLDNCEHVIDAAAAVAEDLLRRCPRLRLIATSREALRVGGETVWPVSPLDLAAAEALFLSRAQAAGAAVDASEPNLALITDICARLDGLPLAIELAAARSRALPLQQIASRLNDRFRLLTGGSRTSLPRQQTLHAVVDWSYELLFDAEQRVFERLSVFPGGCDLATAESVCADANITSADVADVLQTLVDKSLVIAQPSRDSVRYTLLQTLAQYGQEKLTRARRRAANARCDGRSLRSTVRGGQGRVHRPDAA